MLRSSERLKSETGIWSPSDRQESKAPFHGLRFERRDSNGLVSQQVVTILYEFSPGPLPLGHASLRTEGGLLYVYCAGSAWVQPAQAAQRQTLGVEVWIGGSKVGEASGVADAPGQRLFRTRFALPRLSAGIFPVELRPIAGTQTHACDLFHLAVVEFHRLPSETEDRRTSAGNGSTRSGC